MPRVCLTSDLHGSLPEIPECDLLVIAGDICPDFISYKANGGEPVRRITGAQRQAAWLRNTFLPWVDSIKPPVLTIAGNHDYVFEQTYLYPDEMRTRAGYMQDERVEIMGLSIYGTPWVPNLQDWAFYADSNDLDERYAAVPEGLDLLVTHGPPFGYGDVTNMRFPTDPANFDGHVGSDACLWAIQDKKPRAVVCGHIHEAYGHYRVFVDGHHDANLYNVSHMTMRYEPINPPVLIDL